MERNAGQRSRKERRKEARKEKNENRLQSWLQHQKQQKLRRAEQSKGKFGNKSKNSTAWELNEEEGGPPHFNGARNQSSDRTNLPVKVEVKSDSLKDTGSTALKMGKVKKGLKKNAKTKFEEYLEMEMKGADRLAEDDLELEKKLAKKLKMKDGKLRGMDDEMDMLLEGIPSGLDSFSGEVSDADVFPSERVGNVTSGKKRKTENSLKEYSEDEISGDIMEGDYVSDDDEYDSKRLKDEISIKKHKKLRTPKELSDDDNDSYTVRRGSEPEETSGAEKGVEGGATDKPSHKKRQRRKKSKQNQEHEIAGGTANGASEQADALDVMETSEKTLTKAPIEAASVKYIAPHLRARAGNESEEHTQMRRRVRGLLNRLSESNVESVTGEMATIFRSISRSVSSQIITDEVLAAISSGPRGNEQYAAVFASFVAGMACSVGMDFSAKLMASLAKSFEDEYHKEDNISLRNLTLLLSYLCIFGVCSSDLVYDFLITLSKRLDEIDVSTILTVLQCCGMKIRGDDPIAMKNFIQSVQNRVNELKASTGEGQANMSGKRMEFMLETICDIKNNKKRSKEETAHHTRVKKWLQKLRVEDILIRGIKWSKLLDPNKKGQWWLAGEMAETTNNVEELANTIDKEVLEAQKMLQLAASQRMNTDARRAIFCVIMSGDDYIDAFEKLLRLDLRGKQDREIMRVLVECCLQEKEFNKYYTVLASKLCEHDKNHKVTLQNCIWDHFKELESMQLPRLWRLATFVAEMIASFTLSLAGLKILELSDPRQLTPKRIMHLRMLFDSIFQYPDKTVWNVFTRVAVNPDLETLRQGIEFFIREYVVKNNNAAGSKFKVARKALHNSEGILM